MKMPVREYDASDTPSGFLRWSRPASDEPSRVRRLSRGLKATTRRYPAHHLVTWALLLGLPLALLLWYVWTFLTIAYRLPSVLEISIESMVLEQHVWCGMVTLDPWQHCKRGTIKLRIRNMLSADLTIVQAQFRLIRQVRGCRRVYQYPDGLLVISGTEVKAISEGVYSLPARLLAWSIEDFSASRVNVGGGTVEIDTQGYSFRRQFSFGTVQVLNVASPVPLS